MSGNSNVGNRGVYEAGDQRNAPESENTHERFNEGVENSHLSLDSKDERSIANRLAAEEQQKREEADDDIETQRLKEDPTLPARAHGNEPSRGAKIDAQIQAQEEEELKRKGKA
ncbi:uncharacterized protein NECHADRAFT_35755 [Fusarium vanettenii 77-13-4]|uniref:Uncharacterized protein n=1 Tax=Fusarium vanettenii (strain ATCC MYA-4622 / CBS 123669 / FGSC 9596 / NRRL 45880 / 77-13-4) TaxID=660122 RepID=C7YMH8_FUSV7|nr:uncharacterized protein NECHADRAFT_35755 [Fusarium vanettenii 77-13-4]EEU46951.1 hypothetical protein NECHADRAFT_35755 [Fusarium vanettenii 77-13-4]